MTILIDRDQVISSPALVPTERDLARDPGAELTIGLVNNMPDPALKATERQFMKLLQAAVGSRRIRFHCFSLPSVKRSPEAKWHVESEYSDLSDLKRQKFDGHISIEYENNWDHSVPDIAQCIGFVRGYAARK